MSVELPTAPSITRERYGKLARRARLLSWLSLGVITVEGVVAIGAGIVASSIALVGFGLDSGIEGTREPGDRVALHRQPHVLARR